MRHRLPPLAAIRVFEAAARHLSFTRAGEELGMTQAAVSYQIKLLEERFGAPLFIRRPRQVTLTESGHRLAPAVSEAFETLATAFDDARGAVEGVLSISSIPTFAAQWLAQRIGSFQIAHPHLAVRLYADPTTADLSRQEIDVGIRSGHGNWPGIVAHKLIDVRFTPMISPDLLKDGDGFSKPEDLLKFRILSPGDPWWKVWFAAAGVSSVSLEGLQETKFGAQSLEAAAALAGNGIAILTPAFYQTDITLGRLIQPFDLVCEDGRGYWLVYAESRRNVPKIRAFREWLLNEIADLT
ncbi:transcriptional regulator GcvA [Stappia sp. F7233]|uniref:Transcriptional regulator GcvA n=1 Tax=Stappia albiluteola TaxID=2758565 RepID=A0A839AIX4_9HYPH|nr:transcriptional regulator GcvA [Stappia albiluteola]MBA5779095.1 transcriptional regulator GcvA [Stappia albiluteola]